jgi:SAM-dependent methyltransferase
MAAAIPSIDVARAHACAVSLLAETREIVLVRAEATPPPWAVSRGWRAYLLGLPEGELERADTEGIAAWFANDSTCPASLRELAERVSAVTALVPGIATEPADRPPMFNPGGVNVRKRGQVEAILRILRQGFPGLSDIVDVGAGHGHLTRRAAAELALPTVGLERDPERVAVARSLAGDLPVRFVTADVFSSESPLSSLPSNPRRLLMALHGCGELGDAVVTSAVATRARVLLLGCCPQKIRGLARAPLMAGGPSFPRDVLGLANVFARTTGVEGELRQALATKESRIALRTMLAARGCSVPAGEEMRGVNRRKANAGFAVFAEAVCRVRGFAAPSADEIADAMEHAHAHYLAQRRLSLPRSMLGRALEIFLALDRALFLQTHGYDARVIQAFPAAYSPRNLAVLGL